MENENVGMLRAGIAAILAVALAIAEPYMLVDVDVPWQRIVLLSLVILNVLVLAAAFVLAAAAQIYSSYAPATRERSRRRLLLMSNVFLVSTVGLAAITGIFSYVLAIIRIVS